MDKGIRAARQQTAERRIAEAAQALAERFGLDAPAWPAGNNADLVALTRLETVADFLTALAGAQPVKATKGKRKSETEDATDERA